MVFMSKNRLICSVAMIFFVMLFTPIKTSFAALDNKGTDFIVAFNPNTLGGSQANQVQLHLTGEVVTTVTINYPVNSPTFTTTATISPGTVTTVNLPLTASQGWSPGNGSVQNNAVRVFSNTGDEFVMYMINRRSESSDAALALPIDTFNTEYIVMDYNPRFVGSQFVVVAAFDGTEVTITPATNINGHPAGIPFTIYLDRGEGAFFQSSTTNLTNTLTGTLISATRPIGMTNGDGCTQIPTGITACDHIFEVAQPVQSWGNFILASNLPNRPGGSIYRILASENNTHVFLDGVEVAILNKGQFHETGILAGNHVFSANEPIYVTQFMTGQSNSGARLGDPAMGNMIPSDQYLTEYTFATVGDNQFAEHFLTIIANNSDLDTILLDGAIIGAAAFSPIAGSNFSVAVLPLVEGTHTTSSNNGHGITVEGYNGFDSYIYPGGALFQFINPAGDPFKPVCNISIAGTPPSVNGNCTDNVPSEDINGNGVLDSGEDNNGNGVIDKDTGIFFVELQAGTTNLDLIVDPFVPGDPQVTFVVNLIDFTQAGSGTIRVTDGAGNNTDIPVNIQIGSPPLACDVNSDGSIDQTDVNLIFSARGMTTSNPDDPRDANKDGIITVQDARICALQINQP